MTFKYFEHEGKDWPKKPEKWIVVDPEPWEVKVTSFETALKYLKIEQWWVPDCDGGNTINYFVGICIANEVRYYNVEHEFWANYTEDGFYVENVFEVKQITKSEAHVPDDRDWLDIGEYNYKLKKWPPQ